jgi:hypothetical protein
MVQGVDSNEAGEFSEALSRIDLVVSWPNR